MVIDDCGASGRYGPTQEMCSTYHKDHSWYLGVEDGVQRIKVCVPHARWDGAHIHAVSGR